MIMTPQEESLSTAWEEAPHSDGQEDPSWRHLDKQISAFESLVQQTSSRQSNQGIWEAFQCALDCPFPGTPRRVTSNALVPVLEPLDSVSKLRDLIQKMRRRSKNSSQDAKACGDLEGCLKDIQFMRSLKRYFDEKVYYVLYRFFYDPFKVVPDDGGDTDSGIADEEDTSMGIFLTETKIFDNENPLEKAQKIERLEQCVTELYVINQRWENLCSLDELTSTHFESESAKSIDDFKQTDQFYWILRLIPDLLYKCNKCAVLAREWLGLYSFLQELDDSRHSGAATGIHPIDVTDLEHRLADLTNQLSQKETAIRHVEHALDIHIKEFEFLEARTERVNALLTSCEKMAAHKSTVGQKYKTSIRQRLDAMRRLENTVQGTQKYKDVSEEMRKLESDLIEQYKELKLAEYGLEITQTDCQVEADAATSFVIFAETEREKINQLRSELQKLRTSRSRLQRKVAQVKSNHARMMEVLNTKGGSQMQLEKVPRPVTNATYTICRVNNDRYSEKAESSVVSGAELESGSPHGPARTKNGSTTSPQKVKVKPLKLTDHSAALV